LTGEIINLRLARKNKARADAEKQAEENRLKFGRSKAEKSLNAAKKDLTDKSLDGHKRDT
jgi:hypothetical protein